MADPPTIPPPSRRRWKRWVAVALLAGSIWLLYGEAPEIQPAKKVTLGMTEAEVISIIGEDPFQMTYRGGLMRGAAFSRWMTCVRWIRREVGLDLLQYAPARLRINSDNWPVHIRFDSGGRVDRIKRGSEIVER